MGTLLEFPSTAWGAAELRSARTIAGGHGNPPRVPINSEEEKGFEPLVPLGHYGFQDRRLRPLGHSSQSAHGSTIFARRRLRGFGVEGKPGLPGRDESRPYGDWSVRGRQPAVGTSSSVGPGAGGVALATGRRPSMPRRSPPRRSTATRQSTATDGSLRNSPGSLSASALRRTSSM